MKSEKVPTPEILAVLRTQNKISEFEFQTLLLQIERNYILFETNRTLTRIESLQDERNGGIMQIKAAIEGIETSELNDAVAQLTGAIRTIDLTT